ncbi:MAG: HEAT repeat domain-containing protein [Methylococcus sp.]
MLTIIPRTHRRLNSLILGVALCLLAAPAGARLDPIADAEDRLEPLAPALVEGLQSRLPRVRARVALAYGRIQQPASVDPLLRLARDPARRVQARALFALGQLAWRAEFAGGREAEIAEAIARHLGDRNRSVRLAAIEALGKLGFSRVPEWVGPLLTHRAADVRAEALLALFRYRYVLTKRQPGAAAPELPQAIIDRMQTMVRDPSAAVRRPLAYGFARFKDARGLDIAIRLTRDRDRWVRLFAVNALNKIGDPAALDAVQGRLWDRDDRVRWAAVHTLATLGQPAAAGRLNADPDTHVRSAVAEVLGTDKTPLDETGGAWLRRVAADASAEVRAAAVISLGQRLGDRAEADLAQAARDADPGVRAAVLQAARHLNPERRAVLLNQARTDPAPRVRVALLEQLATVKGPEAFGFIKTQLTADAIDIRLAAIQALAARTETEAVELDWQAYLGNTGGERTFLREAAATSMAGFPGADSTTLLHAMLNDDAFTVGWLAYEALRKRGVTDIARPPERLTFSPWRDLAVRPYPVVVFKTTRGVIRIRLDYAQAPIHVANFVGLVKSRFFDGRTWQRVVPNFVIQGGSPSELGAASQDYMLRAEINPLRFGRGAVGLSRSDPFNTGDSQIFITHVLAPHLDGQYTCFGQVIQGLKVVDRIEAGDRIISARIDQ